MANRIYVIGASSDLADTYEQSDVAKFMQILRKEGLEITFDWAKNIFNFIDNHSGLDSLSDEAIADLILSMDLCLEGIDEADAVIVYCTKGINNSMGAQREIGYTMGFDKKIFYYRTKCMLDTGYYNTVSHPFTKLTNHIKRSIIVEDNLLNFIDMCETIRNL